MHRRHGVERMGTAMDREALLETIARLEADYHRLAGEAASAQARFSRAARPDWSALLEAGRAMHAARAAWLDAKRDHEAA